MLTNEEIKELTSRRRVPWKKLLDSGVSIQEIMINAQLSGNYTLAAKAETALYNYKSK